MTIRFAFAASWVFSSFALAAGAASKVYFFISCQVAVDSAT